MIEEKIPVNTKTISLRILRPFYGKDIEKEIKTEKERREKEAEKELGNKKEFSKKDKLKRIRESRQLGKEFFNKLKKKNPEMVLLGDMYYLFNSLQRNLCLTYNKIISGMYHYKSFEEKELDKEKRRGKQALFNMFYDKIFPENLKESSLRGGFSSKIKSNFRIKELLSGEISLPTKKTDSFPIPFWKQIDLTKNQKGFDIVNYNNDFVINLTLPQFEIDDKDEVRFNAQKMKPYNLSLLLSTLRRQRRKGWSRDEGTDAEVRRILNGEYKVSWIEINRGKKVADKNYWFVNISFEYIKSNFICPNCKKSTFWIKYSKKDNEDLIVKCANSECNKELNEKDWLILEKEYKSKNLGNYGGIDIGVSKPIVCAVNNSLNKLTIFENQIFAFNKKAFARNRILLKKNRFVRAGHGSKNKLEPLTSLTEKNERFRKKIIEKWANDINSFFKKNNVGIVRMEDLSSMKNKHEDFFNLVLRTKWPYAKMQNIIKNKLVQNGIRVEFIPPANTSKICSGCHELNEYFTFKYRKENKFPLFECEKCKKVKCSPDYNAAKNMSYPEINKILERYKKDRNF